MAKYSISTREELIALTTEKTFERGDIIIHKPLTFADMQALLKRHYSDGLILFPASPGTSVYTINGHSTSVIKEAGIKRITEPSE